MLPVDAKKALGGYGGGSGGGPAGPPYMPYLDLKKSPLFSGCYNYAAAAGAPAQLPPVSPAFMPAAAAFGYCQGMMNLAAVHAAAGTQLQAALQRRAAGDDLHRFSMMTSGGPGAVRPQPTYSRTPSQR